MRACMARKAFVINDLWRSLGELEDLCCIATRFHMLFAGPVTAFAGNSLSAVQECKPGVRIVGKFLLDLCVAGLANLGANKVIRLRGLGFLRCFGLWFIVGCTLHTHG